MQASISAIAGGKYARSYARLQAKFFFVVVNGLSIIPGIQRIESVYAINEPKFFPYHVVPLAHTRRHLLRRVFSYKLFRGIHRLPKREDCSG